MDVMELSTIDGKVPLLWIELKFAHLSLVKQKRKNRNILPQSSQGKKSSAFCLKRNHLLIIQIYSSQPASYN